MTSVEKIEVVSNNASQSKTVTNPEEREKKEKAKLNEEIQKQLSTKSARKEAIEDLTEKFLKYGKADGEKVESEKEAKKLAKNYVENEYNKERSKYTTVFIDKDAYKAAEKERKASRKELIEKYRNEGLSRREARRKADAQLPENEYLRKGIFGQKKTRAYIEDNKEKFYDENGNFSSDKFKSQALEYANTNTKKDEVTNYHLSLKERRKVAQNEDTSASVIKNIAKKSNLGYEKDNTNLYKGLYVAGMTGVGAAVGSTLGASGVLAGNIIATAASSSSSSSDSSANINGGNGSSSASDSSNATANSSANAKGKYGITDAKQGAGAGALTGLGLGLATMGYIKDKGKTEARVYAPGEKPASNPDAPSPKPPVSPTQPDQSQVPPQTEVETCPLTPGEEHEEFCDYKVKKGEYWTGIVAAKYKREDGTGFHLDPKKRTREENKEIMSIVHFLKDKHGIKYSDNMQPRTMRLYSEINGKKYIIDCDANVKEKAKRYEPAKRYKGKAADGTVRYFYTDCEGNRSQFFNTKEERDAAMQKAQKAA